MGHGLADEERVARRGSPERAGHGSATGVHLVPGHLGEQLLDGRHVETVHVDAAHFTSTHTHIVAAVGLHAKEHDRESIFASRKVSEREVASRGRRGTIGDVCVLIRGFDSGRGQPIVVRVDDRACELAGGVGPRVTVGRGTGASFG